MMTLKNKNGTNPTDYTYTLADAYGHHVYATYRSLPNECWAEVNGKKQGCLSEQEFFSQASSINFRPVVRLGFRNCYD